ncbi:glutamic acid-rich protein-like [Chenopodium quinoa]|uniref:glutamic acid-rich protein-like n=1 Tax=Chenopodium quinoa TaxID=63459 RepID=UPI000B790676|nr:glutamic acid-rich protein-like [Chenopodium quinoa]
MTKRTLDHSWPNPQSPTPKQTHTLSLSFGPLLIHCPLSLSSRVLETMELGFYSSQLGQINGSSNLEFVMLETLLLAGNSLACLLLLTGALLGGVSKLPGLTAIEDRFPIEELRKTERPGPENKDGSDTEDDDEEDEDAVEDQDDDDDEDFSGGEAGGDDDDEGDPEDDEPGANANGEGGSDDDDDDDDDGDDDDDDAEDGEEEEEDEEEEDDQPPAKKRK